MKIRGYGIPPDDEKGPRPFTETAHIKGLGVAPGVAIGPIYLVERGAMSVPEYLIKPREIEKELSRFTEAATKSRAELNALKGEVSESGGPASKELAELLEAHIHMLEGSRLVRGAEDRIRDRRLNAEAAVQAVIGEITDQYATINDAYLAARVHDIQDVGSRLIRHLTKSPEKSFSNLPKGSIIVAEEITPADTALMNPKAVGGFATSLGGVQGHTAIMARSLGLPAVLGIGTIGKQGHTGDLAILDGETGFLIVNPSQSDIDRYENRQEELKREKRALARLKNSKSVTKDGTEIALYANIELPTEILLANTVGAQGIGLVRTEFSFMNRPELPSEEEQFRSLKEIVEAMGGRPVTFRTLDIGGEKIVDALEDKLEMVSENPALGLRAIRLSLRHQALFENQVSAILRAGAFGPIRVLLPMITHVSEVKAARAIIEKTANSLKNKGIEIADPLPPIGAMIEVPAAALAADSLVKSVDFFSIGTNDLTQYTLAIDRANEQVASLFDPLNPAVLRLIQFAVNAAKSANLPVNICGEMAGDDRLAPLLLGLGLRELSMNATALPKVKKRVRSLDLKACERFAETIMAQSDSARIATLISDFNEIALN